MSLNNYLLHILNEQEIIGDQVEVPNEEFETREDAEDFIRSLPIDAIVTNDVIDPETGDILLEAGDSKTRFGKLGLNPRKDERNRQKNIERIERLKARHERLEARGAFLEPEEEVEDEDFGGLTVESLSAKYREMGEDVIGDWLYDHPDADRQEFEQFAQSAAGEVADGIFDDLDEQEIRFLKKNYITDIKGWAADEIYEGMRKAAKKHGIAF